MAATPASKTKKPSDVIRDEALEAVDVDDEQWLVGAPALTPYRALESVAVDPAAYIAWVTDGSTEEKVAALFRTYVTDLGNSTGSAN